MKQHAQELLPVPYSVKLLETFILITWFSFDKKKTYQKILVGPRPLPILRFLRVNFLQANTMKPLETI